MPKLPRVDGKRVVAALCRLGLERFDQQGSHVFLHRAHSDGTFGCRVTVPVHAGKTLAPKTLKSILRAADVTVEELISAL